MQEQKAGKRIVSRGVYASGVSKKAALSSFGIGLLVLSGLCILVGVLVACTIGWIATNKGITGPLVLATLFVLGCLAYGAHYISRLGVRTINEAKQLDTGVPLTRANAAHIPAAGSLVRASQEPAQQQESVLLRAAAGDTQPQDEMVLLRAADNEN